MPRSSTPFLCAALACLSNDVVDSFAPTSSFRIQPPQHPPSPAPPRHAPSTTSLRLWPADDPASLVASASTLVATIDADIDSIPDDEFGRVFAGAGFIILGSLLSLVFVAYLIEANGKYADLVAETYAEQDFATEGRAADREYLEGLGLDVAQQQEAEEMVRAFREKKMRKAGTWTAAEEGKKQRLVEEKEEQDMFSDYD